MDNLSAATIRDVYDNGIDVASLASNLSNYVNNSTEAIDHGPPPRACGIYDFVMEAIVMGSLCIFGFVGNSISTICLWRDKSKTATPLLLVSLEVADTLFLITVLILRVMTTIQTFTESLPALINLFPYFAKYVYPCALVAETMTIYLTILVTVNRYISVCRPYEASDLCSVQYARKHIVLVCVCSIVYNLPRFFEYELNEFYEKYRNRTIIRSEHSDLAKNRIYQILYLNVMYFLVMFLVPLVSLLILNYKLIKALHKTKKKRAQLISSSDSSSRSEDDITLVLIVVVLIFIICQTPALITQLLAVLLDDTQKFCPNAFFYYERASDMMVVANSSMNFIIYCFCSRKFRQILMNLVCKQKLDSPEASHASKNYKSVPDTTQTTRVVKLSIRDGSKDSCV